MTDAAPQGAPASKMSRRTTILVAGLAVVLAGGLVVGGVLLARRDGSPRDASAGSGSAAASGSPGAAGPGGVADPGTAAASAPATPQARLDTSLAGKTSASAQLTGTIPPGEHVDEKALADARGGEKPPPDAWVRVLAVSGSGPRTCEPLDLPRGEMRLRARIDAPGDGPTVFSYALADGEPPRVWWNATSAPKGSTFSGEARVQGHDALVFSVECAQGTAWSFVVEWRHG